jgi:hypothetical protein
MTKLILAIITLTTFVFCGFAQPLTGIWSGKISRKGAGYGGVESLEMQIFQNGKQLRGSTFAFKDTSRFVLYGMVGSKNRRNQIIEIQETDYGYYLLPPDYWPCQKVFYLKYFKIGKTQYLSGTWSGVGNGIDTSCFPGEELLVVLQKIRKPEYPIEQFVQRKFRKHILRHIIQKDTIAPAEQVKEDIEEPVIVTKNDSIPAERKLDIQEIVKLADTTATITLYDNAVIDDDTVSVFVDKKPVLLHQRISDKPLTFSITLSEPGKPVEIIMQAENLGSIPPNTAVMIIQAGRKRYEVRLSAGFEKHAVVIVTYGPD